MYLDSHHRDESLLRAHLSSLVMCPKIRSLQLGGTACSLSFLEPLLRSIGSSLVSFTVANYRQWQMKDLPLILARLPSCMELRLDPAFCCSYEEPDSVQSFKLMQRAHWPPAIQILALQILKGDGILRHVADVISSGALPLLRELYLKNIELDTIEDASYLAHALTKSGGNKLETLHLLRFNWKRPHDVDIVSHMLGLHMEDPLNESFGSLKVLKIDEWLMGWVLLGTEILAGRFPQLREFSRKTRNFNFWFEIPASCTRLWFEVIRSRKIKAFERDLSPSCRDEDDDHGWPLIVKECLSGLALVPLQTDLTSCIHFITLNIPLDGEACTALARAIKLKILRTMCSLRFL